MVVMIELSLLGAQSVRRSDGREFGNLPAQPKRFALLGFLALASGALQRRDILAAMFWPDLDQFAARRALRNMLYLLREALGDGVIITQGDELVGVDPEMITSDVAKLRAAAAAGRLEEAIDLCGGELLAGIHFPNAGDAFEEWLTRERSAILHTVISAMRSLADRAHASGDLGGAAYWASRAFALAPGDEILLRRAMQLLDASGDRGGALRKHEAYAARLKAEFRATPSAETEELASRIRSGLAGTPRTALAPAEPAPHIAAPPSARNDGPDPALVSARRPRALRWYGIAAIALVAVASATWALARQRSHTGAIRQRVLVSVFDNLTGDSAMQPIGRMTQDWLTQGIMRTKLVDVVDQRVVAVQGRSGPVDAVAMARRSGAGMLISGNYYRSGDSLLFQAAVVNATNGRVVRVVGPIVASATRPVAGIDELRSRVMTALASAVDLRVADDIANGGPIPSFDAYEAYVQGADAFWHGDGHRAESLFVRSMRLDTTFGPAVAGAATAAANYHHCAFIDSLQQHADSPSRGLSRVDRLTIQIAGARCGGRNEEMLRLTLERADLAPRTSSYQTSAAAAALWANRPTRALMLFERVDPETDLGWSTDSTHFAYWSGHTEALHLLGRHEDELAVASRAPLSAPLNRAWMRGRALAALARPVEVLALADTILTLPAEPANDIGLGPYTDGRPQYTATAGWVTVWIARELMAHGDSATARQVAARSFAWYRERPSLERATSEERLVAAWALDIMGSYAEARRMSRALIAEDTSNVDYRAALASSLVELGDTTGADSIDAWMARRTDTRAGWSAAFYRARTAALMKRPADAVARVREAIDAGAWPLWIHIDPAIATLAARRDLQQVLARRD